jgi:alkylation response protein AidB-like acyl-CoA dehydrogenase
MTGRAEFNEVFFTDVRVPRHQIVGRRGDGWKVANATLKHERGYLANPSLLTATVRRTDAMLRVEGVDDPVLLDRLMQLQGRVLAQQCHGMRLLTWSNDGEDPGLAGLITKLQGLRGPSPAGRLAIDALDEAGLLVAGSPHARANGLWQERATCSTWV